MLTIKRDPPSQRRFFRLTTPAVAAVQSVPYRTTDWSLGGFRIDGFEGDAKVGEHFTVQFGLNFHGFSVAFQTEVEVVRVEANRTLAARFIQLSEREREVLQHFAASVTAGEMSTVQDTLARMDIPVTPISTVPKPSEAPQLPPAQQHKRRLAFTVLYGLAGVVLATYLLGLLYWRGFNLDIEYAVVSAPLQSITSLEMGRIKEVLVQEGQGVEAGQPMLRVEDDALVKEVDARRLELEQATAGQRAAEQRMSQERERLSIYRNITRDKLAAAKEVVAALDVSHKAAEQQLARLRSLAKMDAVSALAVEQAEAHVAEVHGRLMTAQAELRIGESAQQALRYGSFYDSRTLVGDLPASEIAVMEAKDRVRIAAEQLRLAQQRLEQTTYKAPFTGRVVRLLKVAGTTVSRGETMMLLEDTQALPVVDAYLTQDEVAMLELGSKATVWIPAVDRRLAGTVTRIDRTMGFVAAATAPVRESEPRYSGRGLADRTATVRLSLEGITGDQARMLTGGLPAMVSVPRRPGVLRSLWMVQGTAHAQEPEK